MQTFADFLDQCRCAHCGKFIHPADHRIRLMNQQMFCDTKCGNDYHGPRHVVRNKRHNGPRDPYRDRSHTDTRNPHPYCRIKRCHMCGKLLPISRFYRSSSTKDGLMGRCTTCHKDRPLKPPHKCPVCGLDHRRRGKTCGVLCRAAYANYISRGLDIPIWPIKHCPMCGAIIRTKHSWSCAPTYCSGHCAGQANAALAPQCQGSYWPVKYCADCGKLIRRNHLTALKGAIYCGNTCARAARGEHTEQLTSLERKQRRHRMPA